MAAQLYTVKLGSKGLCSRRPILRLLEPLDVVHYGL